MSTTARLESAASLRTRRILVRFVVVCSLIILVAGLWPFRFHPPNGARWQRNEDGISFDGHGMVFSTEPLASFLTSPEREAAASFTIELLVRPRAQDRSHLAHILSDHSSRRASGLVLAQWGPDLVLRTQLRGSEDTLRYRELDIPGTFAAGQLLHVAISSGPEGTEVYANGVRGPVRSAYPIATEQLTGQLVLGNSGTSHEPWHGDLLRLAVYNRARSQPEIATDAAAWKSGQVDKKGAVALYRLSERSGESAHSLVGHAAPLHVPRNLIVLQRTLLSWDWRRDRSGASDVALNLAGFVPFGLVLTLLLASGAWSLARSVVAAIAAGAVLSLAIEVVQCWLPMRSSSTTDLLMNAVGTAIGAVAAMLIWKPTRQMR